MLRPHYEALGQLGQDEPSSGSNVIPRRARPGLAGLRPHSHSQEVHYNQHGMMILEGKGIRDLMMRPHSTSMHFL